jgi:hypothetical protein
MQIFGRIDNFTVFFLGIQTFACSSMGESNITAFSNNLKITYHCYIHAYLAECEREHELIF